MCKQPKRIGRSGVYNTFFSFSFIPYIVSTYKCSATYNVNSPYLLNALPQLLTECDDFFQVLTRLIIQPTTTTYYPTAVHQHSTHHIPASWLASSALLHGPVTPPRSHLAPFLEPIPLRCPICTTVTTPSTLTHTPNSASFECYLRQPPGAPSWMKSP